MSGNNSKQKSFYGFFFFQDLIANRFLLWILTLPCNVCSAILALYVSGTGGYGAEEGEAQHPPVHIIATGLHVLGQSCIIISLELLPSRFQGKFQNPARLLSVEVHPSTLIHPARISCCTEMELWEEQGAQGGCCCFPGDLERLRQRSSSSVRDTNTELRGSTKTPQRSASVLGITKTPQALGSVWHQSLVSGVTLHRLERTTLSSHSFMQCLFINGMIKISLV